MSMTRLILLLALLVAHDAFAHVVGVSQGTYRAAGDGVDAELVFARGELAAAVRGLDTDRDRTVSAAELDAGRAALAAAFADGLVVRAGGARCTGTLDSARLTESDGAAVTLRYRCAATDAFEVRLPLLGALTLGHRHLAALPGGATRVLFEAEPSFQLSAAADSPNNVAGALFALGIEHILTGYDHLLFLLAVILVGGSWRALVWVVSAFTVAHSVTLGLAAFGVLAPSPAFVEPAIAASICYVGVENWFVKDASRRWMLTLPFGLIHGFGFAGALQEIALPRAEVPIALVSFNLGVEAGQLAVLALVLPILALLRRRAWFAPHGVRFASSAIALAGLVWFVERIS